MRNPNHDSSEDVSVRSHWGLIQVPLNVRDIPQLVGTHVDVWFILIACVCAGVLSISDLVSSTHLTVYPVKLPLEMQNGFEICVCVFFFGVKLSETGLLRAKPDHWATGD